MKHPVNKRPDQWFAFISFILMVAVNALANTLPINNMTTGEISDRLFNLFTPAGYTFSIWGVIYFLLLLYTLHQFRQPGQSEQAVQTNFYRQLNILFSLSSIANTLWILAWHTIQLELSLLLMFIILGSLIAITRKIKQQPVQGLKVLFIRIPFSVYFGWIIVATVANITAYLVHIDWQQWGLPEVFWTVAVLLAGSAIITAATLRDRDIWVGFVGLWAYLGILVRHIEASDLDRRYPAVILTLAVCLALIIFSIYVTKFGRSAGRQQGA